MPATSNTKSRQLIQLKVAATNNNTYNQIKSNNLETSDWNINSGSSRSWYGSVFNNASVNRVQSPLRSDKTSPCRRITTRTIIKRPRRWCKCSFQTKTKSRNFDFGSLEIAADSAAAAATKTSTRRRWTGNYGYGYRNAHRHCNGWLY